MIRALSLTALALLTAASVHAGQAPAGPTRFEVISVKAVRSTLVNTIAALKKPDLAAAKEAFEAFDSGWNGVEVYISVRYPEMYKELEGNLETRNIAGLNAPTPNTAALLSDAQTMLAKYDDTIGILEKATPLNRFHDDVTRLRIVRVNLREVTLALKTGKLTRPSTRSTTTETASKTSCVSARARPTWRSRAG